MVKFIIRNHSVKPDALPPGFMAKVRAFEEANGQRFDTREDAEARIVAIDKAVAATIGTAVASLSYNTVEEVAS